MDFPETVWYLFGFEFFFQKTALTFTHSAFLFWFFIDSLGRPGRRKSQSVFANNYFPQNPRKFNTLFSHENHLAAFLPPNVKFLWTFFFPPPNVVLYFCFQKFRFRYPGPPEFVSRFIIIALCPVKYRYRHFFIRSYYTLTQAPDSRDSARRNLRV